MNEQDLIKLHQAYFIFGDRTVLKILHELIQNNERTFSQLRDNLHINPASLSKKLQILVKFNILSAEKSQDKLRVFYSIKGNERHIKRLLDSIEKLSEEL